MVSKQVLHFDIRVRNALKNITKNLENNIELKIVKFYFTQLIFRNGNNGRENYWNI